MRTLMAAAFAAAMMATAPAWAWTNNCPNGAGVGCSAVDNGQSQAQGQNQHQTATGGTAYGGAGGSGGAGGAGGNAQQQQSNTNTVTNANSNTSTNNNDNSNSGNNQAVSFNDKLQAPAVSSFIAASGPCTGVSGGGAVSVAGFGIGASFASLEEDCKKRELLRIGFASGNQQIEQAAAQGWMTMFADQFPNSGKPAGQTSSTSPTPAAIAPEQTASAKPASCIGASSHTNWYANNCAN